MKKFQIKTGGERNPPVFIFKYALFNLPLLIGHQLVSLTPTPLRHDA